MMGCPSPEHLSAYLAGLLPPNDLATVQAHLNGCLVCEARLSDLQSRSRSVVRHSNVAGQRDPQKRVTEGKIHPAVARADVPPAELGPYQLLEKLGQGGMGEVYKARHRKLDRIEAVKILPRDLMQHAQAVERFEREMRAVAKLDHPHIVRAHHAGEENGQHYLVMEHVDGRDVGMLVKQHTQLRINDACEIVRQAAEGLQHAHESGLVHRDIKPSNLIVSRKGVVKILDLGLALVGAESGLHTGELTSTGQIMGTLDYMAPEQGGDSHQVDIRADLYSLGATLYHMLAGRAPFGGGKRGNVIQKLKALANEEPRPIAELRPEIPAELAATVHRLLSKQPQDRFATPAEVASELHRFTAGHDLRRLLSAPLLIPTDGTVSASTFDYSASPVGATEPTLLVPTPRLGESRERDAPGDSRVARAPSKPPQRTIRTRLLAIVGAVGCVMLGAVVLRISTDRGQLVITSSDPGVKIAIKKSGRTVKELELARGDNKVTVWSGDYEVELSGQFDGLTVKDGEFLLTRGDTRQVHIERIARTEVAATPRDSSKINPPEISERLFQGDRAGQERDDNGLKMKFCWCPPGEFLMGARKGDTSQAPIEDPVRVDLSGFWLGKHEVTQRDWGQVMSTTPWSGKAGVREGDNYPATHVSWIDADEFCRKLTEQEQRSGRLRANEKYALPTEAQWEYGCRAGSTAAFTFGDDPKRLGEYAWYRDTAGDEVTGYAHPVGLKLANAWGLHDMHGNVWEWCADWFRSKLSGGRNPEVTRRDELSIRQVRGGCFWNYHQNCISAWRAGSDPVDVQNNKGFRVARVLSLQPLIVPFDEVTAKASPQTSTGAISVARPLTRPVPVALDLKPLPVELPPHSPLSPSALVARPQAIPGVLSWTIELRRPRLSEKDLQFSPDGAYFATGGDDRVLRVWSRLDGRMVKAFVGATVDGNSSISAVSWSACGRFIAATHFQEGVQIWEVSTGHSVAWIKAPARTARWSPDNRFVALALPGKVQLWDAIEQRVTKELQTDSSLGKASAVAWSPTGRQLATGCKGGIGVFDVETDKMTIGPDKAIPTVTAVEWSPDGRLIAACDNQDNGYIVDAASNRVLDSFSIRAYSADMHWSPDGQSLCLPNSDIRDVVSGTTQKAPGWRISHLSVRAWSPDGNAIYETDQNGMTAKLDLITRKMDILADLNHMIDDLSWSPDGTMVGVHHGRAGAGPILAWRSEGGKLVESPKGAIGEFCWVPPGRRVAVSNDNLATKEAIEIWNLETQQMDLTLKPPNTSSIYLAVSSDGRRMAAIDVDRVLRIWDLQKRALDREVPLQGKLPGFCTFQFSPDAKWLALGGDSFPDSSLWIWNTTDWSVIQKSWKSGVAQILVWSPDSNALSIADRIITLPQGLEQPGPKGSGRLHVWTRGGLRVFEDEERWTIDDGEKKQSFNSRPDGIDPTDFCVSPDERYLVTGGVNGFAWIWDVQTRERVVGFILIPEQQRPLAISPKGHYRSDADVSDTIVYVVLTATGQQTLTPSRDQIRLEKRPIAGRHSESLVSSRFPLLSIHYDASSGVNDFAKDLGTCSWRGPSESPCRVGSHAASPRPHRSSGLAARGKRGAEPLRARSFLRICHTPG